MEGRGLPDRSGIKAIVEEHRDSAPPVAAHPNREVPVTWPLQPVRRKVEGIDFRLRQVVPAGDIALLTGLREPRHRLDQVVLPSPRNDCPQLLTCLLAVRPGFVPACSTARS